MKALITALLSGSFLIWFIHPAFKPYDGTIQSRKYKDTVMGGMLVRIDWDTLAVGPQEVIWYSPGAGQVGGGTLADTQYVIQYGPEYWLRNGWDGTVVLGNGTHRPVFCTIIQSNAFSAQGFTRPSNVKTSVDGFRASRFHSLGKDSAWHSCGFSAGGWLWSQFNGYQPTAGDHTYWQYFKSEVDIEGVIPDDQYDGSLAYPQRYGNRANVSRFHFLGFEQINDTRSIWQIQQNIADSVGSGSAWFAWSDFGNGGHSNFNDFLNPATTNWTSTNTNLLTTNSGIPSVFIAGGQNVFQWMLRQGDTTLNGGGTAPKVTMPAMQQIQLPTTNSTLTAAVSGTYSTTVWSSVAAPTTPTISSTSTLSTGVSWPQTWGNYVYKLVASGTAGSDSGYTRINVVPACNMTIKKRYPLTASAGGIYYPNGNLPGNQPWLGGDTLVLPAGFLNSGVIFGNLSGDPCNPIIIMGPDSGVDSSSIIRFDDHCQYIKFIQNPKNPNSIGTYTMGGSLSNHIELAYIRIDGSAIAGQGQTGIIWKRHIDTLSNGAIVPETIYPNYSMVAIHIHDLSIKHTDGEAMYIGPTAPEGGDGQGPNGFYPVRLDSVEIDHIHIDSSGWDGVQLSGATYGCKIHDDTVIYYGWKNVGSQQCGIIAGSVTQTNVWNCYVNKGTGNGYELFGYGVDSMYNCFADSCGYDGTANGQATVFQDDIPDTVDKSSPQHQRYFIFNNVIRHPTPFGAIRVQNDRGTGVADSIYLNTFCIPGASQSTWQSLYIFTFPAAAFTTTNVMVTDCSPAPLPGSGILLHNRGWRRVWH